MTKWFTSDFHFGHMGVIAYCNRPYKSIDEMTEALIEIWNSKVKPEDQVYFLGDFSLNHKWSESVTPKLNGYKIMIPGNHDKCFAWPANPKNTHNAIEVMKSRNRKSKELYLGHGWNEIWQDYELTLKDGRNVLLSHLPYAPKENGYDMRYLELRPKDKGMFLLHGHQHGVYIKKNNMIDVGIDGHGKLLNEDEVIAYINDERKDIPSLVTEWYKEKRK